MQRNASRRKMTIGSGQETSGRRKKTEHKERTESKERTEHKERTQHKERTECKEVPAEER